MRVLASVGPAGDEHPFLPPLRERGVPVTALAFPERAYLRERRELRRWLAGAPGAVVHTHGYRSDVLTIGVARSLGLPTVTTVHGFTGGGWKNRLYERLQRRAARRFHAVVAVSRPLASRLVREGVAPPRIHLVPNAWDAASARLSREDARARLGLPTDAWLAGWVGRLSGEKGPDLFVEALGRIEEPVDGVMIGEGPERESLRRRAQALGVAERLRLCGRLPEAERLYSAFDCFVLSSRTEGTPIVLFEAMAAGTPVVATAVGGVPDVVSEREALLVPAGRPERLAEAILRVRAEPAAAARRAERAQRRLREERATGPWVARYDDVYEAARRVRAGRQGGAEG